MDLVHNTPTLLRQLMANYWKMSCLFISVAVIGAILIIVYVLSPYDLLSEEEYGLFGLIDDICFILGFLIVLALGFLRAYIQRHIRR